MSLKTCSTRVQQKNTGVRGREKKKQFVTEIQSVSWLVWKFILWQDSIHLSQTEVGLHMVRGPGNIQR